MILREITEDCVGFKGFNCNFPTAIWHHDIRQTGNSRLYNTVMSVIRWQKNNINLTLIVVFMIKLLIYKLFILQ